MSNLDQGMDRMIADAPPKKKLYFTNLKSAFEINGGPGYLQQEMSQDIPETVSDENQQLIRELISKIIKNKYPKFAAILASRAAFLALLALEADDIGLDPGEALRSPLGRSPEELRQDAQFVLHTTPNDEFRSFEPDFISLVIAHH